MDNDGMNLVTGSRNANKGELIVWDFKTGRRQHNLTLNEPIQTFSVKWPLVLVCVTQGNGTTDQKGVNLVNMEKEVVIRHIGRYNYMVQK